MSGGHSALGYRPEIDGLRAIAIVPVILFHLKVAGFSGGLVGVDVFFVISGYLITLGLIDRGRLGACGLIDFYERRARRVLPALVMTLIAVLAAGWVIFMPFDYRLLGKRVVANVIFVSNILLWREADYFAPSGELDPLLHTWSLAVEEQFYFIFPLGLIALQRWTARRYWFWTTLAIALASLALSAWLIAHDARDAAFYLLPSRAWELLLGSLLAFGRLPALRSRFLAEALGLTGVAAIAAAITLIGERTPFPGINALWPCLGAAAILHATAGRTTVIGQVLALPPLRGIGVISYSLYLLHWPIIVFVGYAILGETTAVAKAMSVAAMVALAALSWRFVEKPFRRRRGIPRRRVVAIAVPAMTVLAAAGLAVYVSAGVPQRLDPRFAAIGDFHTLGDENAGERGNCFLKELDLNWDGQQCFIAHGRGPPILFWGDSFAAQYRSAIEQAHPSINRNILLLSSPRCIPVPGVNVATRPACRGINDLALATIDRFHVRTIVLAANWQTDLSEGDLDFAMVAASVRQLRASGLRVKIVGGNPEFPEKQPQYVAYRLELRGVKTAYVWPSGGLSLNTRLRELAGQADFFDPSDALCRDGQCLVYHEGNLIMRDGGHLSPYGAAFVLKQMRGFLEN